MNFPDPNAGEKMKTVAAKEVRNRGEGMQDSIDFVAAGAEGLLKAAADFETASNESMKVIRGFRMALTGERKAIIETMNDVRNALSFDTEGLARLMKACELLERIAKLREDPSMRLALLAIAKGAPTGG